MPDAACSSWDRNRRYTSSASAPLSGGFPFSSSVARATAASPPSTTTYRLSPFRPRLFASRTVTLWRLTTSSAVRTFTWSAWAGVRRKTRYTSRRTTASVIKGSFVFMGPREGEHQEETSHDQEGQPDEPIDAAPGDGDTHDRDPEAEGPEEGPRGGHEAHNPSPPKAVSSPASPVITGRKRSYRVRPHRWTVAEREEIGETQILAALLGVAEMVGGVSDIDELVALIARVTPGLVRVDRCAILAYDEASREFRTIGSFAPGMRRTPFDGLRIQEAEIPWLAQRLIALRLPPILKASSGEAGPSPAPPQRRPFETALLAPLATRGRFLGLLWLDDTRSPHYFTSEEINIVQGIGAQVAIALDGAKLADQLTLERRRIESLVAVVADGLVVADREMRIVSIDAGAEALVGWQISQVRGRRMREVMQISEAEASVGWTKDQRGFTSAVKELRLRARDGHAVECIAQAVAVRGTDGDTVEIL